MADVSVLENLQRQKTLLTAEALAEILNVAEVSVYRWSKKGLLPSVKIGTALRFDPVRVVQALMVKA